MVVPFNVPSLLVINLYPKPQSFPCTQASTGSLTLPIVTLFSYYIFVRQSLRRALSGAIKIHPLPFCRPISCPASVFPHLWGSCFMYESFCYSLGIGTLGWAVDSPTTQAATAWPWHLRAACLCLHYVSWFGDLNLL